MGVFQIESRADADAQANAAESLDDLTVQVALVRPGPIIGGAVHPYVERKKRLREDPAYRALRPPIPGDGAQRHAGAIVFQDQVIEVAMAFAGFSAGEAEGLRRAMSRKRSEAAIRAHEEKFVTQGRRAARSPSGSGGRSWASPASASQGPLGRFGLLAYQLHLAAGALLARVPLRALERAADGLLPA